MSLYQYLQLQPIDPQDDGSVSDLDVYDEDETIDLSEETDGDELVKEWDEISRSLHRHSPTHTASDDADATTDD